MGAREVCDRPIIKVYNRRCEKGRKGILPKNVVANEQAVSERGER